MKAAAARREVLHGRPPGHPWRPLALNAAIYAGLSLLATWEALGPWRLAVWPVQGLLLAGFLAAAHDCSHKTFLRSPLANRVAGAAWSAPVLMNFTATKLAHMVHHRRTRIEGDSEHALEFRRLSGYLWFVLSPTALPRSLLKALRVAAGRERSPYAKTERQHQAVRIDAAAILAWLVLATVLTAKWPAMMTSSYWGPLCFFWPMALLVAIPEHYGCGRGPEPRTATRTTTSNRVVRLLLWNSNYHVEHHVHPSVPSYALPRLHHLERERLQHCSSSYLRFHLRLCLELLTGRARSR